MNFDELNEYIPHVIGKKEKVLKMEPYPGITLAMPGRHQKDTTPPGGDFVVMVSDKNLDWKNHQFKHTDIFQDFERRTNGVDNLIEGYLEVVLGSDPDKWVLFAGEHDSYCMSPRVMLQAVQCLAVAEHRRYKQFEAKFGGRYLPLRFAAGISEKLWTAADAAELQKKGRPGVEQLERLNGLPQLTKVLMNV